MSERRLQRMLAAALAAVLLATSALAFAQPREAGTRILVRAATQEGLGKLADLRKRLDVSSEEPVAAIRSFVWTSPQPAAKAEEILRQFRPHVASDVLRHDHRTIAWPVEASELTPLAKANHDRLRAQRTYADKSGSGLVKVLSSAFTSILLREGLPAEKGHFAAGRSLKWRLSDRVEFTSNRVGLRTSGDGTFAWVGELRARGPAPRSRYEQGFGAASYQDGHVYARFEHGDSIYQLVPLGDGFHMSIRVLPGEVPGHPDKPHGRGPRDPERDEVSLGDCSFGEYDKAKDVETGTGEPDKAKDVETGTGEPDKARDVETGTGEPDKAKDVETGTGEPDLAAGFCAPSCGMTPPVRGAFCSEGPRTCAVVRVGVGVTRQAMAQLPSIAPSGAATSTPSLANARHFARYLVDLTAASFVRSGISARVSLGDVSILDGLDTQYSDAWQLVDALTQPTTLQPVAGVQAWRNTSGSDLVVVLSTLDRMPGFGLIGGMSPPGKRVRDARSGYSVVIPRFADAQLSFLHELGHHLGAYHDPDAGGAPPFPYARGKRHGCEWRTVMAYDGDECRNGTPRLLMWSSCNLWYRGVAVGGAEQNNVRAINRMSGWVAGFRP